MTSRNLFALIAWALFAVAVRAQFAGYPSLEPVLFAELYVMAFAFVMFWLMFARTAKHVSDRQVALLFIGAVAGVILVMKGVKVLQILPSTWEPDYCGDMTAGSRGGPDFRLPPKTFRCTRVPIAIVGWFLGWWLTHGLITRWERAGRQAEAQ